MGNVCRVCGADPCYRICPNNVEFYSPERELADVALYEDSPRQDWDPNYASTLREMAAEADLERRLGMVR